MWGIGRFRQFMRLLLFLGDACARTGAARRAYVYFQYRECGCGGVRRLAGAPALCDRL